MCVGHTILSSGGRNLKPVSMNSIRIEMIARRHNFAINDVINNGRLTTDFIVVLK
jgi:hypothetical protein